MYSSFIKTRFEAKTPEIKCREVFYLKNGVEKALKHTNMKLRVNEFYKPLQTRMRARHHAGDQRRRTSKISVKRGATNELRACEEAKSKEG
jgi:hypothetical protein